MKKIKIILGIFILCLFTSGCWNYRELNELAITTGISIDIKDDKYVISYMIANSKKSQDSSGKSEANTVVLSGEGKSISEAYMNLNSKNPKIPYISHLEVIIISEDAAKEGVIKALDFLMRNPESRKEFLVVLSKGTSASSILETLSPLEAFPSQNVAQNIITNKDDQSIIIMEDYSDFVSNILKEGINPVLSGIEIEGEKEEASKQESLESSTPSANIKINTLGIFKEDKLVGWANEKQTIGINIINNEANSVLLNAKCDNEYMASTLTNIGTESKISIDGDIPKIKLNVKATGALVEINCKRNLEEVNIIKELEGNFENELKELLQNSIELVQKEYKSDVFGFGNKIYKQDFNKWNQIKNNWDNEMFPNIEFSVEVDISLSSKGSFEQTILEVKNEE